MTTILRFLTRTKRREKFTISDALTYVYLFLGVLVMFGPVLWLVLSSFKSPSELSQFPPTLFPYRQETALVPGYPDPLPLYNVAMPDGSIKTLAQVRRIGLQAQMVDPNAPQTIIKVDANSRTPIQSLYFSLDNYTQGVQSFNFLLYFRNTLIVTVAATAITLLVNSMAAFALSKYQFRGRNAIFMLTIGTLMIPLSVILIPVFLVITVVGWNNNLLGVIIPGAATPTGVFLLRQYMLD